MRINGIDFDVANECIEVLRQDSNGDQPVSITVTDLDDLIKDIFETKTFIEQVESVVSNLNRLLDSKKQRAVQFLKALDRESFQSPHGTVSVAQKWRVNLPKTDEDKEALFSWLRDKGIFAQLATVNSNSLNALYMREWEQAKKSGEGMTFSLPGIGQPTLFETLGMRKPGGKISE